MKILNIIQGSPKWHAHRAAALNASDAPAMLGISKYKSRSQLIKERATGIIPDVDDATQRCFNDGHRFEALARPLAEEIIGEELSPITGSEGKYSASFDGITFDRSVIFEHKTLNNSIVNDAVLDEQYRAQMEHQLLVSGAGKCLFMATKWIESDVATPHFIDLEDGGRTYYSLVGEPFTQWYLPDAVMRSRIVNGWIQFEADVFDYKSKLAAGEIEQPKAAPKAEAIQALPSVFVQATGMVTASNLAEFKEAATSFIAAIKTELVCDQDFADAEATVKFCKEAETNLDATKASVLAQMSTVDEVVRTLDHIKKQLADKRLMLDKLVKTEKESRKAAIVDKARIAFNEYFTSLEEEILPVRLIAQHPDFGGSMKGLKKLSAMQDAVDTALRDGKFAADQVAKDVRAKLAWLRTSSAGFGFLFSDLSQLITSNGMEAFQAIVNGRIDKQKADEAVRIKADTARIRAEEEAKATAKAQAEAEAILAERAKQAAESDNDQRGKPPVSESERATIQSQDQVADRQSTPPTKRTHANRAEILEVLAENFGMPEELMLEWILEEFAGDIQFNNRKAA